MKTRFKILYHDAGHILIESETRSDIAHVINYGIDEQGKGELSCSCEFSHEGGNSTCKHREWFIETFVAPFAKLTLLPKQSCSSNDD